MALQQPLVFFCLPEFFIQLGVFMGFSLVYTYIVTDLGSNVKHIDQNSAKALKIGCNISKYRHFTRLRGSLQSFGGPN